MQSYILFLFLFQMFLIQWINTAYDYVSQFYFDLLYSNW